MRIALIHSYYSSRVPSGENNVVDAQLATLRAAGHEVIVIEQQTDARLRRKTYPLEAALTVATGIGPSPLEQLRDFAPDVAHLHNLFPNFGRRWLSSYDGPLVATLHNYRPLCAKATLYRDGHRCTECLDAGNSRPAVKHHCFHDSAIATIPSAIATRFAADPVLQRADVLTTLSEGMSEVYAAAGVAREKLVVLNNYVEPIDSAGLAAPADPGYWIFAGRIEPEKGLHELIEAWPRGERLLVAGAVDPGRPLPPHPDVEALGRVPRDELLNLMAGANGLVFPSIWLEGLALVCLEALAVGTPILTFSDIPAGRAVTDLGVGLAGPRDVVPDLVARARVEFPALRDRCRQVFAAEFTPQAWLANAEAVYLDAISRRS